MSKSGEANIPAAAFKKWGRGSTAAAPPAAGKRGGRRATSKLRRTRVAAAAATAPIRCSLFKSGRREEPPFSDEDGQSSLNGYNGYNGG